MSLHSWLQHPRSALAPGDSHRGRRTFHRAATHRPKLEVLEDRIVPAFLAPVDYSVGEYPLDVRVGDFNNDGHLDLVTANYLGNSVSVLLDNGDGTFQPARNTLIGPPLSLAVGDFNRDGKLDVATANDYVVDNHGVTVLLGQGDGTFVPAVPPTQFEWSSAIAAGDLNADGKLDLVATPVDSYVGESYAIVMLGHGDGTFESSWSGPYSGSFYSLALADFDGDGNTDVLTGGSAMIFRGNGDGTLQAPTDLGIVTSSLTVADFDADGKLDLAATNSPNLGVSVLRGNGDGTFQPARSFAAGADPYSISAASVSGDGVLDLVVTNRDAVGGLTVLLGTGDGSFGPPITTVTGADSISLAVADFNADGRPDAAVTDYSKVSVLLNDGSWSPADPPSVSIREATVTEGNTGTLNATFTLALSKASNVDVTVHYATADISAVAGSDYTAASGTVVIPAGRTSATITVAVTGDRLPEPTETFSVNLSAATNATIGDGRGVGTIVDNEPRISITDVSKKEGKKNQTTQFTFTVMLSVAYDQPVTVSFQTVNGTATTSDNDYVAKTGTLTFAPGETTKTITIDVKGDSKKEADETFYLDLSANSSNSLLTKKRGIGTILNDD
jgi:hypothetical protein